MPGEIAEAVEADVKYSGYVARDIDRIATLKEMEGKNIPENFDYESVVGLKKEARAKLKEVRPRTFGQAARISGVNGYLRPGSVGDEKIGTGKKALAEGN